MNNPKSTLLGWGSLILAAGVSYYWAKQGINERRREQAAAGARPTEKLDWRAKIERDAATSAAPPAAGTGVTGADHVTGAPPGTPSTGPSTQQQGPS
ncbi:hypothetical protein K474DRAFT_1665387 [Panus rudis PR-1116 ss-1]|nr:hypothetical protein K474DRAFT_1665387 [Panus rudis PR-1116 ss-1]